MDKLVRKIEVPLAKNAVKKAGLYLVPQERLGELAGACHLLRWDGFDKNKKNVSDGSTFTLSFTLADGTVVSAHGNNAFPENYADVYPAIRALYDELMEEHGLPA